MSLATFQQQMLHTCMQCSLKVTGPGTNKTEGANNKTSKGFFHLKQQTEEANARSHPKSKETLDPVIEPCECQKVSK